MIIYLLVGSMIQAFIQSPPVSEIDSAAHVWEILGHEYDSAFTIFGH